MSSKFFAVAIISLLLALQLCSSSITNPPNPRPDGQHPCAQIEKAFGGATQKGERPICQCIMNSAPSTTFAKDNNGSSSASSASENPNFWIGCTGHKMTAVFRALQSLPNATRVPHLHIWDSLLNILPNDPKPMFTQIRADQLTIERSRVGLIREGAFANVDASLRSLSMRNNILKGVESKALSALRELRHLDLSWNKLVAVNRSHFASMTRLEELILTGNQLSTLEDGLFQGLARLRVLNLANNNLRRITRSTFKGLISLEHLTLSANKLDSIDRDAFVPLKALKVLELGFNNLTRIDLHGNALLERLVLNNNSIRSLADCKFAGLTALRSLQLGNNNFTSIEDSDLRGLAQSAQLASLSLDGNNISRIGCRAFEPAHGLQVLSLQHNHIFSLSCSADTDPISFAVHLDQTFLHPLHSLRRLVLSQNSIRLLNEDDFAGLGSLRELALDHNRISKVSRNAFAGLRQLQKLFLNDNHLYYLPNGVFADWDLSQLRALDLSGNMWECICGEEWLGAWLATLAANNSLATPSGSLGCLAAAEECEQYNNGGNNRSSRLDDTVLEEQQEAGHYDAWIRLVACVLAFVAILFLVIAGYVYMQEARYSVITLTSGRGGSSDTIRLIPSVESLFALPNPISSGLEVPKVAPPSFNAARDDDASIAIRAMSGGRLVTTEASGKKRVRFQ